MHFRSLLWILVSICVVLFQPGVYAGNGTSNGTEAEARAAFVKLVAVAKKHQTGEFKKMIAKADLQEMEAMEKESAGMFKMIMDMVAADDPKDFKAEVKENVVTFVKQTQNDSKEMTGTTTITVTLIREGNQWKFGKAGR
jgi:uncharacterized membrane protein